jgi:hypothetical protein
MKEYYYQIKGKTSPDQSENSGFYGSNSNWVWPPIFSGKVEAPDKKKAKILIESEYDRVFPLRVLSKDLDSNEFLLSIKEIVDNRTRNLFKVIHCKICDLEFRQIDLYNDANSDYKGNEYCSRKCANEGSEIRRFEYSQDQNMQGYHQPVIYKITNKITNLSYIGKTTQAFTLRWYQHFYQGSGTKFHQAIKDSKISDWIFEVIELVVIEKDKFNLKVDIDKYILERERFWINELDVITNGYNSI